MTNVVVDTSVFLYSYDKQADYFQRCVSLLNDSNVIVHTTTKNISECVAMMTKLNYPKQDIERVLEEIYRDTTILFPSPLSLPIFKRLFSKYEPRGNRVFDLEIVSIMLSTGLAELATINAEDFRQIQEISLYDF